jgi:hypothetical protein
MGATIINKLRKIFAVHGICNELVSDNGSQFVSEEFKSYLEELGIKHTNEFGTLNFDISGTFVIEVLLNKSSAGVRPVIKCGVFRYCNRNV